MEHGDAQDEVFRQVITSVHDDADATPDRDSDRDSDRAPAEAVPPGTASAAENSADGTGAPAGAVVAEEPGSAPEPGTDAVADTEPGTDAVAGTEPADAVPTVAAGPESADAVPAGALPAAVMGPESADALSADAEPVGAVRGEAEPVGAVRGDGERDGAVPVGAAGAGAVVAEEDAGTGPVEGPAAGVREPGDREMSAGTETDTLMLSDAIAGAFGSASADATAGTGTPGGPAVPGTPPVVTPEPPPAPPVLPPATQPRPAPVSAPKGRPRARSVAQPPLQRPLPPPAPPFTPPQPGQPWPARPQSRPAHPQTQLPPAPPQPWPAQPQLPSAPPQPWPAQPQLPSAPPQAQPQSPRSPSAHAQPAESRPGNAQPPAAATASRPPVAPPAKAQHGPRRPLPAPPNSVPAVDSAAAAIGRGPRRGDSVARRAGQAVRRLVVSSAAREVAELTGVAEAIQQPVVAGRQIAVTSIRGGAGKTTVAALLGLTYTHYRPDPVLSVEADAALGTLPVRLGADTVRWTCADLAHVVNPAMQFTDITGYLLQTKAGGWLLPGSQGQVGARLDIPAYRKVTGALRRHFNVTVVDCETLPGELARTALDTAQARVLVAPATMEGVAGTRTVLDWMAGVPRMIPGTVVVLNSAAPYAAIDTAGAARYLAQTGVTVLPVPYDRHLAAGGVIRVPLLARDTRLAAGRLAAALLDRANGRLPQG